MAQFMTALSMLQKGTKSSSIGSSNHGDPEERQNQVISYIRWEKVTMAMSFEQRRGFVASSSPSSGKTSKRSERCKSPQST